MTNEQSLLDGAKHRDTKPNRPTARDFVDAFKRHNIKPVQGKFFDKVVDGKYASRDGCGCAITAFMCGKTPTEIHSDGEGPLLRDFGEETGIKPWTFVRGFDGSGLDDDDAILGREVLELLKAEGFVVLGS